MSLSDGENDIELTPAFASDTYAYAAEVPNVVESIVVTITPTFGTPDITVTVGEEEIEAEEDGTYIIGTALADEDTLAFTVTSAVGTDSVDYEFTITLVVE